ncbi:hypothetical protein [Zooshikella ganghwensis]|nr:hypothetical protein [Zooshikella ganghwensis]
MKAVDDDFRQSVKEWTKFKTKTDSLVYDYIVKHSTSVGNYIFYFEKNRFKKVVVSSSTEESKKITQRQYYKNDKLYLTSTLAVKQPSRVD